MRAVEFCNPISAIIRSSVGAWRSLVAHLHGVQGVASSNLVAPTNYLHVLRFRVGYTCGYTFGLNLRELRPTINRLQSTRCGRSRTAASEPLAPIQSSIVFGSAQFTSRKKGQLGIRELRLGKQLPRRV